MQFILEGRVIKGGKTKAGKPWANVLVEGKDGAADVTMVFPLEDVKVGSAYRGMVDAQVQFAREVVASAKK